MILLLITRFFLLVLVYHSFEQIKIVMEVELHLFVTNFIFMLDLIQERAMLSLYGLNCFLIVKGLCCCAVWLYHPPSKVSFYELFTLECEKLMFHNAQNFQSLEILILIC